MITGDEIRAARERAHLSQRELGDRVGVSLRTIGNWERGETVPRSREQAIRDALGLEGSSTAGRPLKAFPDSVLLSELSLRLLEGQLAAAQRDQLESEAALAAVPPPTPAEAAEAQRKSEEMLIAMLKHFREQGLDPVKEGGFSPEQVLRIDTLTIERADELARRRDSREATDAPPIPEDVAAADPRAPGQGDVKREVQDAGYDINQDPGT